MVANRILKNTLEKRWQLPGRPLRVLFGELQHRVLYDVQRRMLIAHREYGLLECPALDRGKEV